MWEDPIVAEVHRTRQELAERFNFDVIAIVADIRKRQAALGPRLISLAKPAEATAEAEPGRKSSAPENGANGAIPAA
jgi:hypothetical protein